MFARLYFRSFRYDKHSKLGNVLSSRPLSLGRAREILEKKLEVVGVDPCVFSNHSFRSG